jgi:hypothetical protein
MLINLDTSGRRYDIALNNASSGGELISDLSYLDTVPPGTITLDFRHMAAALTQETREEYLPGSFGYQPTLHLLELVSVIAAFVDRTALAPHTVVACLPRKDSRVGRFLANFRLPEILAASGITLQFADPSNAELGNDDLSRHNLIPMTVVRLRRGAPDFKVLKQIRDRVQAVFAKALARDSDLANRFTSVVSEAVDNLVAYGQGGIIGGLYYRRVGEVEITLSNRLSGFGGQAPAEQLEALLHACEKRTREGRGGNGIPELSRLTLTCFGTLLLRNGNASIRFLPDGSVAATTEETGFSLPGASVTALLQLLPDESVQRTEPMKAFEEVLARSLLGYRGRIASAVASGGPAT